MWVSCLIFVLFIGVGLVFLQVEVEIALSKTSGALTKFAHYNNIFISIGGSLLADINQTTINKNLANSLSVHITSNKAVLIPKFYFLSTYKVLLLNGVIESFLKIFSPPINKQNVAYRIPYERDDIVILKFSCSGIDHLQFARKDFNQLNTRFHSSKTLTFYHGSSLEPVIKFSDKSEKVYLIDLLQISKSYVRTCTIDNYLQYNNIEKYKCKFN